MAEIIKAVIFDLDGVIVSTDEFHYRAWKYLADMLWIRFDRKINERLRGVDRDTCLKIILEAAGSGFKPEHSFEEMARLKNERYKQYIGELGPDDVLEGVREFLYDLDRNGIKKAIGSSSKNALTILDALGLRENFDVIVSGLDIRRTKPDPEVFLKAAEAMDVEPENCVVIEDAQAGIDAAVAAGMRVIGISRDGILTGADILIEGLHGMSCEELYRKLDTGRVSV